MRLLNPALPRPAPRAPAPADFRKDYTKLSFFKQRFPGVPLIALTATATPRVQHDVVQQLGIQRCLMFKSSFNRPNLRCAAGGGRGDWVLFRLFYNLAEMH